MKAVTLSFEKFGFLRNVTEEETGEFLLVILDYAMTGKMPEFKDKYQKMYYQTYLDMITEQMITATKRAKQSSQDRENLQSAEFYHILVSTSLQEMNRINNIKNDKCFFMLLFF